MEDIIMHSLKQTSSKSLHDLLKTNSSIVTTKPSQILTGMLFRSIDGKLMLTSNNGYTIELPADTIEKFQVVDTSGVYPIVELRVEVSGKFYFLNPG
ncbi:hypothetical protein [Nitrosomonas sp.]|uniref:hypothetical protein n=1 Tax=Nitrosomonas sp. TaxID=42353 RepID=UPI0025FC61EB|nr:hypothetical protein [Nitrosomonas sp.]MBY0485219.1 hypothetical protein [Nitrosomonas sp.]